jgi:hypothetical protein
MFNWNTLSTFELGVTFLLIAIWALGLVIYGKLSYLVRIKELELRKNGIINNDDN